MKAKYRPGIFIVTYRKNKGIIEYIILKRKMHWVGWEFPKGGLEGIKKRFFLKNNITREIKEETNLDIISGTIKDHKTKGKYKYDKPLPDRPGIIGQTYRLFSCEVKGRAKISSNVDPEHSDLKWLTYDKALKKITYSTQRKGLRIVNKYLVK